VGAHALGECSLRNQLKANFTFEILLLKVFVSMNDGGVTIMSAKRLLPKDRAVLTPQDMRS
jgi:hypothetical protein